MGMFRKRSETTERLNAEIATMAERLDAADTELGNRVNGVLQRLTAAATPPPPSVDPAEFSRLRDQIAAVLARIDAVDARITAISTELANQLEELSREIDADHAPAAPIAPELLDESIEALRDTQIRLANEQARYQIAFRRELAELADRLRRP